MTEMDPIASLRERHATLDRLLEEENGRPQPDSGAIADIKRQKLAIKDELAQFEETVH
ncbi:MAG: YdcH family protein [Rhodospirillaceae bacterium]|jgi:hypothetical protein|nr:YdcH family protein [Rhodospirillaceae bacterium]MBT6138169.1 YdcH family protein [Rhodospirillaceae bacterium]